MNRRYGLSVMGFAIVFVIIFGLVMIISAPSFIETGKVNEANNRNNSDIAFEIQQMEKRLNNKIESLNNQNSIKNKYVCTIEGNLDQNGNIVPPDSANSTEKFVFVCEYY